LTKINKNYMKHIIKPNVVNGGKAIPIGDNFYLMRGRKHAQGGIDIGANPKTGIEVEDGEVMHLTKKSTKVFSALPIINGNSPADLVMSGENPSAVFDAQEDFKDRNDLNNDGTSKHLALGGQGYIGGKPNEVRAKVLKQDKRLSAYLDKLANDYGIDRITLYQRVAREGLIDSVADYNNKNPKNKVDSVLDFHTVYKDNIPQRLLGLDYIGDHLKRGVTTLNRDIDYEHVLGPNSQNRNTPTIKIKDNNVSDALEIFAADIARAKKEAVGLNPAARREELNQLTNAVYNKGTSRVAEDIAAGRALTRYATPSFITETLNDIDTDRYNEQRLQKSSIIRPDVIVNDNVNMNASFTGEVAQRPYNNMKKYKVGGKSKAALGDDVQLDENGNPIPADNTKFGNFMKSTGVTVGDAIGAGANIIGSLVSSGINTNVLNKMQAPPMPTSRPRFKLKTKININPQLAKMRETVAAYERDIRNNTGSSAVALARLNRVRGLGTQNYNELMANKENIETQLLNQDTTNAQNVATQNVMDRNRYAAELTQFKNSIRDARGENANALTSGLVSSVQDILSRGERRRQYDRNLIAIAAANPNVSPELLRTLGWDRTMIGK
jgi:hypothetical protein